MSACLCDRRLIVCGCDLLPSRLETIAKHADVDADWLREHLHAEIERREAEAAS